jgi:hypothetical protein
MREGGREPPKGCRRRGREGAGTEIGGEGEETRIETGKEEAGENDSETIETCPDRGGLPE